MRPSFIGPARTRRSGIAVLAAAVAASPLLTACGGDVAGTNTQEPVSAQWEEPTPSVGSDPDLWACTDLINERDRAVREESIDAGLAFVEALLRRQVVPASEQDDWVEAMEADVAQLEVERAVLAEKMSSDRAELLLISFDTTIDILTARVAVIEAGSLDRASDIPDLGTQELGYGAVYGLVSAGASATTADSTDPYQWLRGRDCEVVLSALGPDPEQRDFVAAAALTCAAIVERRHDIGFTELQDLNLAILADVIDGDGDLRLDADDQDALDALAEEWRQAADDLIAVPADDAIDPHGWEGVLQHADQEADIAEQRADAVATGDDDAIAEAYARDVRSSVRFEWEAVGLGDRDCRSVAG